MKHALRENSEKKDEKMKKIEQPEPWLRGTLTDVPAVQRGVLHALELAGEDLERWTEDLTDAEINSRPSGIAPVAFHLRHISRSMDRLLTYAEGAQLSSEQIGALKTELDPGATKQELFAELMAQLDKSSQRIRAFSLEELERQRHVGRKELPTTAGGLLVHVADHTQRHVGQAITTAKIVMASRSTQPNGN
jgi:uncharacterized damage-inducible protein DinB